MLDVVYHAIFRYGKNVLKLHNLLCTWIAFFRTIITLAQLTVRKHIHVKV